MNKIIKKIIVKNKETLSPDSKTVDKETNNTKNIIKLFCLLLLELSKNIRHNRGKSLETNDPTIISSPKKLLILSLLIKLPKKNCFEQNNMFSLKKGTVFSSKVIQILLKTNS